MVKDSDLKLQRDRFLAFAFAGADFLIEIDAKGKILFSTGATKTLTGYEEPQLRQKDYLLLFQEADLGLLKTMHDKSRAGLKQGPYLVSLKPASLQAPVVKAFVSGISMPGSTSFYLAFSKGDSLLRIMGFEKDKDEEQKIADNKAFETLIQKKIPQLVAEGKDADLTFLHLDGIEDYKYMVDQDKWQDFMSSIAETVMSLSLDGETAADLEDGRYVLLQDTNKSEADLQQKIMEIAKTYDLGNVFDLKTKKIEGDLPNLSAREATRAIIYTMNQMEQHGIEKTGKDLKKSFKAYLDDNTVKIKTLKNLIAHQKFTIHFQPIVDLNTNKTVHHEVLMRFENHASPYDLIVLGEDVGIAPDIDIAVCRQALKYADQHKKDNIGKLAVNLSGASIQNEAFIDTLVSTLHEYPDAARHIIFEVTESSNIKNLDMVNGVIQRLRKEGHAVCLDDFGAGAASFQYLHKLLVDGVKIDGAYTRSVLTTPRDATMIKNLTQMCHELDIFVVAEMVETEEQARYLRDIGVDKGQGWLFGKAAPTLTML